MKNKALSFRLFLPLMLAILLTNCRQIRELSAFSKCEFRLASVNNTTLAGVNVQNVRSLSDLSLMQAGRITSAYASGSMPLNLVVNLDVRNPNPTTAALNQVEWILQIEGKDVVDGILNERVAISPDGGITTLPIRISADLRKIMDRNSAEENLNMGLGLAGANNQPSPKLTLRIKPSIMIGSASIRYPGYINVNTNFGTGN
jgi:LEA14-like dessication related protein